jgi:hypothetical protein
MTTQLSFFQKYSQVAPALIGEIQAEMKASNRPHLPYHNYRHIIIATNFSDSVLTFLEKLGYFTNWSNKQKTLFATTMHLGILVHDYEYNFQKQGDKFVVDPKNELNSYQKAFQLAKKHNLEISKQWLKVGIIHTKVSFNSGIVQSANYDRFNNLNALIQLVFEMADKAHCIDIFQEKGYRVTAQIGIEDNLRLYLEAKFRELRFGNVQNCKPYLLVLNKNDSELLTVFDNSVAGLITFIRNSIIGHIEAKVKVAPTSFKLNASVANLLSVFQAEHLTLIDVLQQIQQYDNMNRFEIAQLLLNNILKEYN